MKKIIKTQNLVCFAVMILLSASIFTSCTGSTDKTTTETTIVDSNKETLPPLDTTNKNKDKPEVIITGKTPPPPAN